MTKWIFCPSSSSSFNQILQPFCSKFHINRWSYLLASAIFSVTLVMTQATFLHNRILVFYLSDFHTDISHFMSLLWWYLSFVYACDAFMMIMFDLWILFMILMICLVIDYAWFCWSEGWVLRWHIYGSVFTIFFLLRICSF